MQNTPVRIRPPANDLIVQMIPADPVLGMPIRLTTKSVNAQPQQAADPRVDAEQDVEAAKDEVQVVVERLLLHVGVVNGPAKQFRGERIDDVVPSPVPQYEAERDDDDVYDRTA